MEKFAQLIAELLAEKSVIRIILSQARKGGTADLRKVIVRPVMIRQKLLYQFERHLAAKVTHENLTSEAMLAELCRLLTETFRQAQIYSSRGDFHAAISDDRRVAIKQSAATRAQTDLAHNRAKHYFIPDKQPCDFLIRLGVMSREGKILSHKSDKFHQINRFLEMVEDVAGELPHDKCVNILDFGCGKSYLTFAIYYLLHVVKGLDIKITGLDLKPDAVKFCNEVARDLGYAGLSFELGDISSYGHAQPVDMMVTLHACDTATDAALAKAIQWGAKVILSVPCCQHELFGQIRNEAMRPLLKHGLIKERVSALITDSLRAQLLEIKGYAVQMLEFIDAGHTPKNILIRAVKRSDTAAADKAWADYEAFRDFWGARPFLEKALAAPADSETKPFAKQI